MGTVTSPYTAITGAITTRQMNAAQRAEAVSQPATPRRRAG